MYESMVPNFKNMDIFLPLQPCWYILQSHVLLRPEDLDTNGHGKFEA